MSYYAQNVREKRESNQKQQRGSDDVIEGADTSLMSPPGRWHNSSLGGRPVSFLLLLFYSRSGMSSSCNTFAEGYFVISSANFPTMGSITFLLFLHKQEVKSGFPAIKEGNYAQVLHWSVWGPEHVKPRLFKRSPVTLILFNKTDTFLSNIPDSSRTMLHN